MDGIVPLCSVIAATAGEGKSNLRLPAGLTRRPHLCPFLLRLKAQLAIVVLVIGL